MAEDVMVEFGAKIDELVAAVDQVKEKISETKEAVEKSAGPLKELEEGVHRLMEAFLVEKVVEFVRSMGELGEQVLRTGAMLGISTQSVLELQGIAQITGGSIEGLSMGIERMSLNIQRSTRDATNPTAQALKLLGLNAKDLIGIPADEYFKKLADAVGKFEPSLNLTNALMQVGGRGIAQLIPTLREAGVSYDEFRAKISEAQGSMADQIKGMAESNVQIKLLGISTESLGAQIFTIFKPAIDGVVATLSVLVQWFRDAVKEGGAMGDLFNILAAAAKALAIAINTLAGAFDILLSTVNLGFGLLAGKGEEAFATWGKSLDEVYSNWKRVNSLISGGEGGTTPEGAKGASIGAIDFGGKGAASAAVEAIKAQIEAADAAFAKEKDRLASMVKLHEITHTQETASLLAALDVREAAEKAAQERIIATYPKGSAEYEKAQAELTKMTEKGSLERQKIMEAEQQANVKDWTTALDAVKGAWDSQLKGLLDGTTTWASAMKTIVADLVLDIIKELEKVAIEKVALGLSGLGGPTALLGGLGSILGFQVGTDYVPQTGLALVHQGEAIIPAWQNPAASSAGATGGGGGGGSASLVFNVSALDSAGVQAFFNRYGPQIAQTLSAHMNANPSYAQ